VITVAMSRSNPAEGFTAYDYAEPVAHDNANLDSTWLRDPNVEDSDNLRPPEMIAQEIVDELLNESSAVAEALEAAKAVREEGST
jgi:type I restriction enzyme M protein